MSVAGSETVAKRVAPAPETPATSLGPPFELLESKLRPPQLLRGHVPRTELINLLRESRNVPIIAVSAAPGYGKTTLLAGWALKSRRRFAWVSVDGHDNDPIVLLSYIAAALDRACPLDPAVFEALASGNASIEAMIVPRLGSALAQLETSFVLILDDLHALTNPQCLDAIDALIDHIPEGSQMVLSGRAQPSRRVGALRARGLLLEIGPDDLRMGAEDARPLFAAAGVEISDAGLSDYLQRTEGWPAGLYLAALSIRAGGGEIDDAATFRGDDRFIADYLRSELFSRLPADELRFLTRTSVLERMSGPLCDALLESADSAEELGALERSNLFVVALDRHGGWYRYHHLFGELLRAELERAEVDLVPELLARASDWCGANGEPQAAVSYAQAAGDVDRVAGLVGAHAQSEYEHGRAVTAEQWFSWLEDRSSMEQHPGVAVLGAWLSAIRGRPDQSERWADVAESGARVATAQNGASIEPWLAVLRAAQCRHGVERMAADAQLAATGFGRASPFWPTAAVLLALSHQFSGDDERADDLLAEVAEMAVALELSNPGSLAFSLRALIAIERQDWVAAEELTERAESIARRARMEDYTLNAVVSAASARFAIHRGEQSRADQHLARAQRLRPQLTRALAPFSIHVRIQLARAYAARADVAGARTLLRETNDLLRRGPDFGTLAAQANELSSQLQTVGRAGPGASSLTTAELRLIPFLPTHLSFREVGERLYVSHNTVRTQVRSIYLKLDVTSRSAAVGRARELGIL